MSVSPYGGVGGLLKIRGMLQCLQFSTSLHRCNHVRPAIVTRIRTFESSNDVIFFLRMNIFMISISYEHRKITKIVVFCIPSQNRRKSRHLLADREFFIVYFYLRKLQHNNILLATSEIVEIAETYFSQNHIRMTSCATLKPE